MAGSSTNPRNPRPYCSPAPGQSVPAQVTIMGVAQGSFRPGQSGATGNDLSTINPLPGDGQLDVDPSANTLPLSTGATNPALKAPFQAPGGPITPPSSFGLGM
jgi:hypothetical protein